MAESMGFAPDAEIRCRDYPIGCIGAGFIMADVHLAAYAKAGFPVAAIASRTPAKAGAVAERWGIPKVHATPEELIADPAVAILDIAYPPDLQPELIRLACAQPHIRAILAQKPVAMGYAGAREVVEACEKAGKVLSVNTNMRFDQSMRVLKQLLDRGALGDPVIATVEMRAVPHWQEFLKGYDRLTFLNMSIHHIDVLRFLFGEAESIYSATRADPRTAFAHKDGIVASTIRFESGVLAVSLEDVWSGPREEGFDSDIYIKWRVEGTTGVAQGTIGWPDYPDGSPSTLRYASKAETGGKWVEPTWDTMWFPDAFAGVMEQLQFALSRDEAPMLLGRDNLATMALIEAGYRSMETGCSVRPSEITT
jgi:predicted dehydrogenase